jgi:DNA-binding MarR family transcriptional regulator
MTHSYQYLDDALLQKMLKKHQQNLAYLEGQAASFGASYIPLSLHNDITSEQEKIMMIITELEKRKSNNEAASPSKEINTTSGQSQSMHILQILHREHKKGIQDLDLIELSRILQITETAIKPDIDYLNEKGWISLKKYLRGIEIIRIVSITNTGIDALTNFQDIWES